MKIRKVQHRKCTQKTLVTDKTQNTKIWVTLLETENISRKSDNYKTRHIKLI